VTAVARRLGAVLVPLAFGVAFVALWQLFVVTRHIKPILLPKPSGIWHELIANRRPELSVSKVTGFNALVGLVAGTLLGAAAAFVASKARVLGELLTPLAVAASTIPIVVLVSVFNNLFAITSELPRRLMVTIVVFFVVFVNVARGLTQTSATQLELMRSYAASDWAQLRKVRVPNALPFFFTALKIAAPLAVVTSFVSEYFGGRQNGLGDRITSSISASRDTAGWAYVTCACLLGLLFYVAALVLERVAMPWRTRAST
jgi:NitT/TauT family transport system permease protein